MPFVFYRLIESHSIRCILNRLERTILQSFLLYTSFVIILCYLIFIKYLESQEQPIRGAGTQDVGDSSNLRNM